MLTDAKHRAAIAAWLLAAMVLLARGSLAGPFSQLVVFGDSLSDVGNIAQATFGITPGPYYDNGRFTNGPVYVDGLAAGLGLPAPVRSRAGGNKFAHGGAKTSGTSFPNSLFVQDIDDQVGQFLATRTADPNALFVVFAGANDLIGSQTNVNIPVNRLATDVGRLITAGARNFLIPNLPLLGYTPRYNGNPSTLATYNSRSEQFNASLDAMLDGLEASHPALAMYRLDVAAMFHQAITQPAAFGLTNVSDAAAPGLSPGAISYDTSLIAANPNEYLFWDDLHPTTAVHAILADHALALLFALPGDFNGNGIVDAADYTVWRDGLGAAFAMADYDTWKSNFGAAAPARGSAHAAAAVPEPNAAAMILALIAGLGLSTCRQLRRAPSSRERIRLRWRPSAACRAGDGRTRGGAAVRCHPADPAPAPPAGG